MGSTQQIYTVLLYGETGVGKSTFINACDNYIKFPTLEEALVTEKICCRVPIKFSWHNEDYEDVIVEYGSHDNENFDEEGASVTQSMNMHYYKYKNKLYRFVDTPGFNDTKGYEAELENVKRMMNSATYYFSDFHALCILLKPGETRESLQFRYGIMQFLSMFHRNVCDNIIFLYTHSKGIDYKHNASARILRNIISEIKDNVGDLSIPYGPKNAFLLDNDGFRYLLAVKLGKASIDDKDIFSVDWNRSAKACFRILEYIQTLETRSMQDTLQVNDAKVKLEELHSDDLLRNEKEMNRLQKKLDQCKSDIRRSEEYIKRLENSLYDTVYTIREGPYHMICTNVSCAKRDVYSADGKACCPNCTSWTKYFCHAFYYETSHAMYVCRYCGCSMDLHDYLMKRDFKEKDKSKKNLEVEELIFKEQKLLRDYRAQANKYIDEICILLQKYKDVRQDIAQMVKFLKENCILPFHKECIEHLRMEIKLSSGNKKDRLEKHLERYVSLYKLF